MDGVSTISEGFTGLVTVTHVQGENKWLRLWIQVNPRTLQNIQMSLAELAPKLEATRGFMHQCQVPHQSRVLARSTHDGQWHRGVVIDWAKGSSDCDIIVQLIDYGRSECIDVNLVRGMEEPHYQSLNSLPPCSKECWLADVWPIRGSWSNEAIQAAIEFLKASHLVQVVVTSRVEGQPMLHVTNPATGISLGNFLVLSALAISATRQQASPPFLSSSPPTHIMPMVPQIPTTALAMPQPQQLCYSCWNLELGTSYRVVVSHLEGPHQFFVQLLIREAERFQLAQNITAYAASNPPFLSNLSARTPCLAHLSRDNVLARALILQASGDGQNFTVHFVDIGCHEKKPYNKLLAIPPELMTTHVLAYECQLAVALQEPSLMAQVVLGKVFDCHLLQKNGNRLVVSLTYQGQDISQMCLAQSPMSLPRVPMVHPAHLPQSVTFSYRPITLSKDFKYKIVLTYVRSPTEFYGQLLDNTTQIDDQMSIMNTLYAIETTPFSVSLFTGVPVVAQYSVDGNWYRAEVKQPPADGMVEVTFVDYGNSELVQVSRLRQLHSKFQELPRQALQMSLHGFEQTPLTPKVIEAFEKAASDQEFTAEIMALSLPTYSVNLYTADNQCLNRQLLASSNKISVQVPVLTSKESIYVTAFTSADDFFGQLVRFSDDDFATFSDELHSYFSNLLPINNPQFEVGDIVVCKFVENDTFYRAQITGLANQRADIFYIDFGNKETVGESQLFPLAARFAKLPQQGIACRFAEGDVKKLPAEKMKTLMEEATIELKIVGTRNSRHEVELTQSASNKPILDAIEAMSTIPDYARPMVKVGTRYEVVVTDMTADGHLVCQLQTSIELLEGLMEEFDAFYQALGPQDHPLRKVVDGAPCAAKFSTDGGWYRARITSTSGRQAGIYFVDYGNSETLPLTEVKALLPQFQSLPQQTIICELFCVTDSAWTKQNKDKVHPVVVDKSFTATIRGQDPIAQVYKVDIFDADGNNVGDQLVKSQEKPVVNTNNNGVADDWDDCSATVNNDNSSRKDSFNKSNFQQRDNRGKGNYLLRDADDSNSFDKPRGRFGGSNDEERPKRNFRDNDSTDWPPKSRVESSDRDSSKGRFNRNEDKFGSSDREKKPWENKDDSRGSFQNRNSDNNRDKWSNKNDSGSSGNNNVADRWGAKDDSSQSFGPKFKSNSPIKPKPEVKLFGTFLDLKPMSCADVSIVHVVSPSEFYCHLTENSATVMALLESMDECYSKMLPGQFSLLDRVKDSVCCAQSSEDSAWYRARVQQVQGLNVEVLFVDYGNTEAVPDDRVKILKEQFHSLPIQAIKCSLINVKPVDSDWKPADVSVFKERTLGQSLVIRFHKSLGQGSYQVQIVESTEHDRIMKDLSFTKVEAGQDPLNFAGLSPNVSLSHTVMEVGLKELVEVVWVDKPNVVKCQIKSSEPEFKAMMEQMQTFYNNLPVSVGLVNKPAPGMFCVAQFTEDNAWYRGQVKLVKGAKVEVYYVDYGNREEVSRHSLRCLSASFGSVPCHAVECHLQGICVTRDVTDAEAEKMYSGEFTCSVVGKEGNAAVVQLQYANGKDLASELVNAGICAYGEEVKGGAFPKPILPQGAVSVYISQVNSLDCFYVQLASQEEALTELSLKLSDMETSGVPLRGATEGAVCCAKFSEDEQYYRAVVLKLSGGSAEVLFVDFGNTDTVAPSTLLQLPLAFMSQPPFALECSLSGITSGPSSESEALTLFKELVNEEKVLSAVFSLGGRSGVPYRASITDEEGDIKQRLLDSGHVQEVVDTVPSAPTSTTGARRFPAPVLPSGAQACFPSHVDSILSFYLQLSSQIDSLTELGAKLNEMYSPTRAQALPSVAVGAACCAQFTEDSNWYRAEVVSIQDSKATVRFVDFGNCDKVDVSTLKYVTPDLLSLPPYSFKCRLRCLSPTEGREKEATDLFFTLMNTDTEMNAVFGGTPGDITVTLSTEAGTDISQELVTSGVAVVREEGPVEQGVPKFVTPSVPSGPVECFTSQVISIQSFYLQLSSQTETLEQLATRVNQEYSSGQGKPLVQPTEGAACCAQFSQDEAWYRALVTNVQGDKATVLFVDYGNSEEVEAASLKCLSEVLLSCPPFAFHCRLGHLVPPADNEQQATDTLFALTEEKELTATFLGTEKGCLVVSITTEQDGDLGSKLVEAGLASVEETTEADNAAVTLTFGAFILPVGPEKYFVSHVNSIQSFFLQLASQSEGLSKLAEELNATYSSESGLPLANPVAGTPCCSQFSEDDSWYRARIVSIQENKASVFFIDYGNSDEAEISSLKALSKEHLAVAPFAVECRLGSLVPIAEKEEEATDLFTTLTADAELTATLELIAGAVRATLSTEDEGDLAAKFLESSLVVEEPVEEVRSEDALTDLLESVDLADTLESQKLDDQPEPKVTMELTAELEEFLTADQLAEEGIPEQPETVTLTNDQLAEEGVSEQPETVTLTDDQSEAIELTDELDVVAEQETCNLTADVLLTPDLLDAIVLTEEETAELQILTEQLEAIEVAEDEVYESEQDSEEQELSCLPSVSVPEGEQACIIINSGLGPSQFFIQLNSQDPALTSMNIDLERTYSASQVMTLDDPKVGTLCCAQYALDAAWYRALIVDLEDEKATVLFVDYGNSELVLRSSLCPLLEAFTFQPPYAYVCSLAGIAVAQGGEDSALHRFTELTQDKELVVTFVGCDTTSGTHRVKLCDQDGDLTQRFLDSGLLPKDEGSTEALDGDLSSGLALSLHEESSESTC